MYRILIAEDEPLVRIAFKSILDWEKSGFSIVSEASNGKDALDKLKTLDVDVLVTDISMPLMDGLELLKEVRKIKPETLCIVLSAYDDFKLVKEAFQLGVADYILKPDMDRDRLTDLFNSVKEQLDQKKRAVQEQEISGFDSAKNRRILKEAFLKELLFSNLLEEDGVKDRVGKLGLRLEGRNLCVCTMMVQDYFFLMEKMGENNAQNFSLTLLNLIDSVMEKMKTGEVMIHDDNEYIAVFTFKRFSSQRLIRDELIKICTKISQSARKYMNVELSFGISHVQISGFNEISKLYSESRTALDCGFLTESAGIIFYEHVIGSVREKNAEKNFSSNILVLKQFLQLEGAMNPEEVYNKTAVNKDVCSLCDVGEVKGLYGRFCTLLVEYAKEKKQEELCCKSERMQAALTQGTVLARLNEIYKRIIFDISTMSQKGESVLTLEAKKFIYNNYSEAITLSQVSSKLHVSTEHLCRVFSQEEGKSFMKFLVEYRMEKAKEYLRKGDLYIADIASKVGYSSVTYFNNAFKKTVGKSPREYKRLKNSASVSKYINMQ